jgi:hypothetical protein
MAVAVREVERPAFTLWGCEFWDLFDPELIGERPGGGRILLAREEEFTAWLVAVAELGGWEAVAWRGVRAALIQGSRGHPDMVALRGERIEVVEVKSEVKYRRRDLGLSEAQNRWRERYLACQSANPVVQYRLLAPRHAWLAREIFA